MNPALLKKTIRTDFQRKIDAISFGELIEKSRNLVESFHQNIVTPTQSSALSGKFFVSFHPFGNEPQINIESEARHEPYSVAYVRVTDWASRSMAAVEARRNQPGNWEELEVSAQQKIFQPSANQPLCDSDRISAILGPGIAFSRTGARLGRGAGFYDRFLKMHPHALRIGVAFEEQIADTLPSEPWDEKVDVILTDRELCRVIEMKLLGEWRTQGKILDINRK